MIRLSRVNNGKPVIQEELHEGKSNANSLGIILTIFSLVDAERMKKKVSVTFLQLEKQNDQAYAIFADDTNKVYYKMKINRYEYDHWNIEENTLLEDLAIQEISDLLGLISWYEIKFDDKWHIFYEF
ncbi:hypothetical protein OL548_19680 [Lysinibacillus sp. MHQ-1]|nr:hypothetical protein OL548_19680 [Lysinibacillus sp. MHQ-1]